MYFIDRASIVQLRRFAALLDRLPYWENNERTYSKRRILLTQSGIRDSTGIVEFARSGNAVIDKCIITFASLSLEVELLTDMARNEHFRALLTYGEDVDGCLEKEGGAVKMMARFLPFLQELSVYINRCYEVFRNFLLQLHNFFGLKEDTLGGVRERKLLRAWRTMGNLLSILVIFDEIIQKHSVLRQHWSSFFKAMQMAHHNPSQFGAESEYLRPLQGVIVQIDSQIMNGFIFKNCCQQMFGEDLRLDSQFNERLRNVVLELYDKWDHVAVDDIADKQRLMVIISLASFHAILFRQVDKKLIRTVWGAHKRLPAFHLIGETIWTPCDFLVKSVNDIDRVIDRKSISAIGTLRSALFDQQAEMLTREATSNAAKFVEWQYKMAEELCEWPKDNPHGHLTHRTSLFFKGARQADQISRLLKTVLNGHLHEQKAVSRSSAVAIFRLTEIIKGIEETFVRWWDEVVETCQQAVQQWSGQLLLLVSAVKESMRAEANLSYQKVDIISALTVAEIALSGAVSRNRLIVTGVALEMACYTKVFRWSDVQEADDLLTRLDLLVNFGKVLSRLCDCIFLYSHRTIVDAYFDSLLEDTAARPELFFEAINDAEIPLNGSRHAPPELVFQKFCKEIFEEFEKRFLAKLCEAVETDLRLSIHSHLQLEDRTPKDALHDVNLHLVDLVQLAPLRLGEQMIDIKRYVERYLERTFYNLTAVALHDCHTYTEMRLLADHKYGLILCESRLPFQTLDQGLDVLVVTRNIHSFVSTYNYNLNGQFFVEKDSKNKQLNILTVEHIANSIRTHGMGIMNTTINFAYQYLKKKFFIFSQFLFDDHIKSQLAKDVRFFRENADELKKMYPVKRAQRFNTAIRRLGVTADDLSFLDKFRILITQIGNVMGYVRLVRSGGIEASSQSLAFLPDLDDVPSFLPLAQNASLSEETMAAAKILDGIFDDATKSVNQTNNYLQILLEVFAKEFRNFSKFDHLGSFYIIVPPLTINFTEHILACKGKLGRRAQQNNTFTDDGFILGVAFILTLLDQLEEFSSLNWFQSVENKCVDETTHAASTVKGSTRGTMEPSVALRVAKVEQYQKVTFSLSL
ncbi:unnamed protein product [Toxocara canis]|uniref:WASH complex subunit 7 n=1 Tax=Toxocara canis TaxID=6265 RepID=A0A3P7FLK2_TOXCA|nr:unnamed protein product [Toxocara canis]